MTTEQQKPNPVITEPNPVPQTYEDCLSLITKTTPTSTNDELHQVLRTLKSFFEVRATKKKQTRATSGEGAVKALMEKRHFDRFQPKVADVNPLTSQAPTPV